MSQSNSGPVGDGPGNTYSAPVRNVVDTAVAVGTLVAFSACIRVAGLTDALVAKGPFTLFAPSDAAFGQLPAGAYGALLKDPSKLRAILNYHIVNGYLLTRDMKSVDIMTLQGTKLAVTVSPPDVRINAARIVQPDIAATNGVVHMIDAVILPRGWQLLAVAA